MNELSEETKTCSYCKDKFTPTSLENGSYKNTQCQLNFFVGDQHHFCCENHAFSWLMDHGAEYEFAEPLEKVKKCK